MIRPVLRAGKEPVTDVAELPLEHRELIHIHPNPGRDQMTLNLVQPMSVSVWDMSGRLVDVLGTLAVVVCVGGLGSSAMVRHLIRRQTARRA